MSKCKHTNRSKTEPWIYKNKDTNLWTCKRCSKTFSSINEALSKGVGIVWWTTDQAMLTDQEKLDLATYMLSAAREVPSGWSRSDADESYTDHECEGCYQKNKMLDAALHFFKIDDLKRIANTTESDFRVRWLLEELRRTIIWKTRKPMPEDYLTILTEAVNFIKAVPDKKLRKRK